MASLGCVIVLKIAGQWIFQSNSNGIQNKKENQETQILMHGSDP